MWWTAPLPASKFHRGGSSETAKGSLFFASQRMTLMAHSVFRCAANSRTLSDNNGQRAALGPNKYAAFDPSATCKANIAIRPAFCTAQGELICRPGVLQLGQVLRVAPL
jgi:hypothetical protein